jgi:O-antigen/teichoic acid export membrane protein
MANFRRGLLRCLYWTLAVTLASALTILILGQIFAHILFDGNIALHPLELICIALLLPGLGLICLSVYLQNGLGRFGALVRPSFLFVLGSLASVPLAMLLQPAQLSLTFIALYASVHLALALVHGRMLTRLGREVAA